MIKKVIIDKANRLYQMPPDIGSFFHKQKKPGLIKKTELIDLSGFNWPVKFQAEPEIDPSLLGPASKDDLFELKKELADWFESQCKVRLLPKQQIFIGGSISNMLTSIGMAFVDQNDLVFVPEIGIPIYRSAMAAFGGQPVSYQISSREDWSPDFERLNSPIGRVARLMIVNSPHNPTGRELSTSEWEKLVWTASRENIAIIQDGAYYSIPQRTPASMLGAGGKKVGVELHSLAYLFGLPNVGAGIAVGHRDIISGLEAANRLISTKISKHYVKLTIAAIRKYPSQQIKDVRQDLTKASAAANSLLELLSLEKSSIDNSPFIWAKIKRRSRASNAANILYRRSRIKAAPGTLFGEGGEGFLRFSLTAGAQAFSDAASRVKSKLKLLKFEDES